MAGFAQQAFMDAQRDWKNNKRDTEWDQRVAAFQAKRENDPARQMMIEDEKRRQQMELEKQTLINEGPAEVARINGRFGLDNTQLRETGSNQRSAMLYDLENQKNQFEQFKFLQNPYGDNGGDQGMGIGGVDPAAGYDARRSQLNQYMGGNIGGSQFQFGNNKSSPGSQSSATVNGVPMEYILGEGREVVGGGSNRSRMSDIAQAYAVKSRPDDIAVKRSPVMTDPSKTENLRALPSNHMPVQRAIPQIGNDNAGTFIEKVKQMQSPQGTESHPVFRKFNFDPDKKKKIYPRAGSGNMWSRQN